MSQATLHFLIGKMGAGKSTRANALAAEQEAIRLSEDEWLAKLFPNEIQTFEDFVDRHRRLLNTLLPHIERLLALGNSVVLDFPANQVRDRQRFAELSERAGATHQAHYLKTSDELCLTRIAQRAIEQPERANTDTAEMFAAVQPYFEEPTPDEKLNLVVVDQG